MRDRLIELIKKADDEYRDICDRCDKDGYKSYPQYEEFVADRILANGVIAPPCKVGVEVYFAVKERDRIFKGELISFSLDAAHFWFFCRYYCGLRLWHQVEDFGKTVFLTGKEAEQALKGEHHAEIH